MNAGTFGALPAYVELQVASDFSFLHRASRAEEYVARAAQLGYSAIAITDECSLAGVVRAHVEAKSAGPPLIVGSHFRLTAADGAPALAFTALAMNRDGYGDRCDLVSLNAHAQQEWRTPPGAARSRASESPLYAPARLARLRRDPVAGLRGQRSSRPRSHGLTARSAITHGLRSRYTHARRMTSATAETLHA